ncbi:BolA protein 3 [Elysia marginata]|uniref:BolA protein 3 n=1 Tax=Elysia marginata TaxID=1093978 RepID=A0AAV4ILL6_9GAST|nr:BolA protein 3 [Elysia marginata]
MFTQPLQLLRQVRRVLRTVSAPRSTSYFQAFSTSGPGSGDSIDLTAGEKHLIDKIRKEFPDATHVEVSDVSGGCGAMYQVFIESPQFKGKRTIQQHRMVNEALAKEIENMHGIQLNTKAPDTDK